MVKDVVKRTVMCTPYGITQSSARGYIRDKLPKTLPDGSPTDLALVTKAVFKHAIPAVIPGPIKAMKYIQQSAVARVKKLGGTSIRWTTPSGFVVIQDLRKSDARRIETHLMGQRLVYTLNEEKEEPDITHHRGASAPNLIHSMDSTLLHLTFADAPYPFTLIHDCVLTRSCDMDKAISSLRENFVGMYRQPILSGWADQLGVPFDVSIDQGTLNIEDTLQSNYLFC
jgi:DNA-directed RNA polymerase